MAEYLVESIGESSFEVGEEVAVAGPDGLGIDVESGPLDVVVPADLSKDTPLTRDDVISGAVT